MSQSKTKLLRSAHFIAYGAASATGAVIAGQLEDAGRPTTPRRMQRASTAVGAVSPATRIGPPGGGTGQAVVPGRAATMRSTQSASTDVTWPSPFTSPSLLRVTT